MPSHRDLPVADATSSASRLSYTSPLKPRGTHVPGVLDVKAAYEEKTPSSSRPSQMSVNAAATDPQKQDELKDQVMEELRTLTFEDPTILRRFLEVGKHEIDISRKALSKLKETGTHSSLSLADVFPPSSLEKDHYAPFVKLFNTIGRAYHKSTASASPYIPLKIYTHPTLDGVDGAVALKPDLITVSDKDVVVSSHSRYRWGEISIAGEIKSQWADLVAQAGTYGRAILNAHPTRTFALVLGFNHSQKTARFLFFHRRWDCVECAWG